jgi:hypothetical protein
LSRKTSLFGTTNSRFETNSIGGLGTTTTTNCPTCPDCRTCPQCPTTSSTAMAILKSGKTTTITSLHVAWQEMEQQYTKDDKEKFRVLSNVIVRTKPALPDEITLLTHISANQLERLLLVDKFWGGPMSIAVWIKDVPIYNSCINLFTTKLPPIQLAV